MFIHNIQDNLQNTSFPACKLKVVSVLSAWAFGERLMRVLMGVTFSVALSEPCLVLVLEE